MAHGQPRGQDRPDDPDGSLSQYSLPTAGGAPADITAGPDGALWFTERIGNRVGRITTNTAPDALPTGPEGPTGPAGPTGPEGPQGPAGLQGAAGRTTLVLVAFQVKPLRPRAGRRLRVRFAITAPARAALRVGGKTRTVARKRVRKAGIGRLRWNGRLGKRRARPGRYVLTVRATKDGRTVSSRLRVRLR